MEVQCPDCSSRFNLPDNVARPGAKLRCSQCKHVFTLQDPAARQETTETAPPAAPPQRRRAEPRAQDSSGQDSHSSMSLDLDEASAGGDRKKKKKKKSKLVPLLLFVLLLACGGGGAWWYLFQPGTDSTEDVAERAENVKLMTIRNVRQYYVENEKVGPIFVIEGKVVNQFPEPKEFIEVEAAIYDKNKKTLVSKRQLAGTSLSVFQIQVLGEDELESFLSNQIEILTRNTKVPSGGQVPFMVLIYNPPVDAAEFGVKIANARDVETP